MRDCGLSVRVPRFGRQRRQDLGVHVRQAFRAQ